MLSIQVFKFFVSLITILSCHVGPQASRQPSWLLWQDVCWVPERIFSQWWVLTREDTYKIFLYNSIFVIFFQERFGSASTSFTAWPAKDPTRWKSPWSIMMEPALWRSTTSSRLYQIKLINICHFENLIVSWIRLYFDLHTGRCRGGLCSHSCWVQRCPLNPRGLMAHSNAQKFSTK